MEQIPLDFSVSAAVRHRRAVKAAEAEEAPTLFSSWVWSPNIDVYLHSRDEAVAHIAGSEPERAHAFLNGLVGPIRVIKPRRVGFPAANLHKILNLRPPAQVTLDAATAAIAKAQWAAKLDLKPLTVTRERRRLLAHSVRWPPGMRVKDAPWGAIASLIHLGLPLHVEDGAQALLASKLEQSGAKVATAALAGSAVALETTRPDLIERLDLPGLAYDGPPNTGRYKLPVLSAEPLLRTPLVDVSTDLATAVRKATAPVKPLKGLPESFPWTLYNFQAEDAGRAKRILETTGGVLLAGEMGSGKTTVALALAADMDLWPTLVVSPLSAFSTWARQLGEMGRSFYLATEAPAKSWEAIEEGDHDAVVISFDRLQAFTELIDRKHFRSIMADEIQRIRTPGSKRSRALRSLAATVPYRIGLSGTPLTNTTADVLPLGAFLAPGEWRPRANEKDLEDMYPGDPVEGVAEHLGALMVRRRIDQVGQEMAKRNDHRVYIQLTPEQRRALNELEEEAQAAKEEGTFDGNEGRMHAFAKLQRMRQIINCPTAAGLNCPNPKVSAALDMAKEFLDRGRKGVIFCADRTTFTEIGEALDKEEIGWVGIWGSTPPADRIENERKFHAGDPAPNGHETSVVLCTIQAGAESWSASPTGTWLISTAYVYAPSTLAQMEARVHRMNSDVNGPEIEIMYIHAQAPGQSLDDRMVEILEVKKQLFAQVVDRRDHIDSTRVSYSMSDLMYLMTGEKDEGRAKRERDVQAHVDAERERKLHARRTLHGHKARNKDLLVDDGAHAITLEQYQDLEQPDLDGDEDLDALLDAADHIE